MKGFIWGVALCVAQLLPTGIVGSSAIASDDFHSQVVYGPDNRLDLYQVKDTAVLGLADSTVALISRKQMSLEYSGVTKVKGDNFGKSFNLCSSEPFRDQEASAFCSGFLIAPDIVLTAGHCMTKKSSCADVRFVFGYSIKSDRRLPVDIPDTEIYYCSEILHSQSKAADFAIIQLDRVVRGHRSLKLSEGGAPAPGHPLFVIGHPMGLPTKVAGGGRVRTVRSDYLVANLDVLGGNSGSAVFNGITGQVEGILVRGEGDFVKAGNCQKSKHCPNSGCRGEDVTLISKILPYLY